MKQIEIFIDESGRMGDKKPMNISGIALVGKQGLRGFHDEVYVKLNNDGLTAGVCDGRSVPCNTPADFLPKRPDFDKGETWNTHWERVNQAAKIAANIARDNSVEIVAFSLTFPSNTESPWRANDSALAKIIDRPYDSRLQDVLELLFFETEPISSIVADSEEKCAISLNLPTRTTATIAQSDGHRDNLEGNLRNNWGKDAWRGTRAELMCNVMESSDGIQILTSVLNRRRRRLPDNVTFERCCCCKLLDWEKWGGWNDDQKRKYGRYEIAPRQSHYLADFLSNAVFNESDQFLQNGLVSQWLEKGFFLGEAKVAADPWILASRLFANGDRVGAIKELNSHKQKPFRANPADFFRKRSGDWLGQLSGDDLCTLFREMSPAPPISKAAKSSLAGDAKSIQNKGSAAGSLKASNIGEAKREALDILGTTAVDSTHVASPLVRWRVSFGLSEEWDSQKLMEYFKAKQELPQPTAVRSFLSSEKTEFILDLQTEKEVREFISASLEIGDQIINAEDVTLPRSFRTDQERLPVE